MNTIVVGLQNGDEGKGRVCDQLMERHDVCVRYSGGPNTGASVWVNDERFKFHHIPVGVLQQKECYIGPACYISPPILFEEIEQLKKQRIEVEKYLHISHAAHIITEAHIAADTAREASGAGVGSTKRGISPCAVSKYDRTGLRAEYAEELRPFLADVQSDLNFHLSKGQSILFEGSQGTLLDIDHGFYPYVSTSHNTAAAACMSCGVGMKHIGRIVGVFKPYLTKVGRGPFPTKITDETEAETLRQKGSEFGTTTGRPRDVGWLDLPLLRYAIEVNGCTDLAVTKLDIVRDMKIKVCVAYKFHSQDPFPSVKSLRTKYPAILNKNFVAQTPALIIEPEYVELDSKDIIPLIERELGMKVSYIFANKNRSESSKLVIDLKKDM